MLQSELVTLLHTQRHEDYDLLEYGKFYTVQVETEIKCSQQDKIQRFAIQHFEHEWHCANGLLIEKVDVHDEIYDSMTLAKFADMEI